VAQITLIAIKSNSNGLPFGFGILDFCQKAQKLLSNRLAIGFGNFGELANTG